MVATMLGLLASCSLGNDLRCHYSIEMPSLLKRMNQTQLPSKSFSIPTYFSIIFSLYAGKPIDRDDQSVNENNGPVNYHWLYHFIKLPNSTLLC